MCNNGYNIGRHKAFADWLKEGAFSNPYQRNTPEWEGYNNVEESQNSIDRYAENYQGECA